MAVSVLTTTNAAAQTWTVPADCPAGTVLTLEAWGAGSGASGGSSSFQSGGAGGAYTTNTYTVDTYDVVNGIPYYVNAGSAGTAAANSTAGPDTWFGKNTIQNTSLAAVVPGTPGTLPTNWSIIGNDGLTTSVIGSGIDATTGWPYVDVRFNGTTSTTAFDFGFSNSRSPATAGVPWVFSIGLGLAGGSTTNVTSITMQVNWYDTAGTLLTVSDNGGLAVPSSSALGTYICTATTPANTVRGLCHFLALTNASAAVDITLRIAAPQLELGSTRTTFRATPTVLARGGGATSGTTGGTGGSTGSSFPSAAAFKGGNGATRAQGGGGGGGAGENGVGTNATSATGGTGDNGSGGAANTDNVEGGGGGTASASGHVGGNPGGGGGANTGTGSGGNGGRGQVRLTYAAVPPLSWQGATDAGLVVPSASKSSTAALTSGPTGWAFAVTPPLFDYDWFEPLRDPYLIARMPVAAIPAQFRPELPPSLGIIGWYRPLSTPPAHHFPRTLPIAVSSPAFFPGFAPIVVPAPAFGYYTPFGNPPPPLPKRAVYMPPATGPPPNYAFDRWFQEALSEPPAYLRRPHLSTAVQKAFEPLFTPTLPAPPLVSNIHPGLPAWRTGTYSLGQRFSSANQAYQCIQAGTSNTPPTGTGSFIQMVPASGFSSGFSSGWGNPADTAAFKWLSNIDYTSMQAWSNDIMAAYSATGLPGGGVTAVIWNDSLMTAPLNSIFFAYYNIPNNGAPTLITCAPGDSWRDSTGNPTTFNQANGVAFDAPATGAELNATPLFYIDNANVTLDGFQLRDLNPTGNTDNSGANANILVCMGGNPVNFTLQNCLLDGYHLFYTNVANSWLKNCVLINEQTQQAPTGNPLWPVKWDIGASASGGAINCTGVGFNPTGTCSMFTTLGSTAGLADIVNTCVFGLPNPFFCQNTGGTITVDHCATDQPTVTADGATDAGGNLVGLSAAAQFLSVVNDFRLKASSGLIDRARADLVDLPSGQDVYRTPRPQGLGWDIGAVEFVFALTWLAVTPQTIPLSRQLPVALRTQEPTWVSIQRAEVTRVDRYYHPLSRPLLPLPGLAKHLQPALVEPISVTRVAEATTVDRWAANYPAFARGLLLHPSLAPSLVVPVTTTFVQDVSRLQWNASWPRSVPGRAIHPSVVPFSSFQPISPIFRETIGLDRWYQALSMPQLWRRLIREHAPAVTGGFVPIHAVPIAVTVTPTGGSVLIQGFSPLIRRQTSKVHS